MKLSARNQLPGTVKKVVHGAVNTEVIVEIAPGVEMAAIITRNSAESLGIREGSGVVTVVKASNVMLAVD